jgi:hypothetical protein
MNVLPKYPLYLPVFLRTGWSVSRKTNALVPKLLTQQQIQQLEAVEGHTTLRQCATLFYLAYTAAKTPGRIDSPLSKGPHSLIRQGAKLVESIKLGIHTLTFGSPITLYPDKSNPPEADKFSIAHFSHYNIILVVIWQPKSLSLVNTGGKTNIVTACDANFFRCLEELAKSVRKFYGKPVIVYDLGLTEEQKQRKIQTKRYDKRNLKSCRYAYCINMYSDI